MKTLLLLALFVSTTAFADGNCREESLIHFYADGHEVSSQLIGASDACDQFGGNLVHSPKFNVYLYVNFNIPGRIDLTELDGILGVSKHPERAKIDLAVVDAGWIQRVYHDDREAVLNLGGDTLFISEKVLENGRWAQLLQDFYNID